MVDSDAVSESSEGDQGGVEAYRRFAEQETRRRLKVRNRREGGIHLWAHQVCWKVKDGLRTVRRREGGEVLEDGLEGGFLVVLTKDRFCSMSLCGSSQFV
ncbi:MAG: hypothetical protein ACON4H_10465 [Rubripirellula sp.]